MQVVNEIRKIQTNIQLTILKYSLVLSV